MFVDILTTYNRFKRDGFTGLSTHLKTNLLLKLWQTMPTKVSRNLLHRNTLFFSITKKYTTTHNIPRMLRLSAKLPAAIRRGTNHKSLYLPPRLIHRKYHAFQLPLVAMRATNLVYSTTSRVCSIDGQQAAFGLRLRPRCNWTRQRFCDGLLIAEPLLHNDMQILPSRKNPRSTRISFSI